MLIQQQNYKKVLRKRKISFWCSFVFLSLVVLNGIFVHYVSAQAEIGAAVGSAIGAFGSFGGFAGSFAQASLFTIVSWILYLPIYFFGTLFSQALIPLMVWVAKYNNFLNQNGVTLGWQIVRDLANIFIVIGIIIIAAGTLLKIEAYEYKKMLPKLVIAAVLINFSKTIIGFLIDFSQVIMLTFVNAFESVVAGNLITGIGLEKILSLSVNTGTFGQVVSNSNGLALLGSLIMGVIALVVVSAVMLVLIVFLVSRIIMLWIAIILSPLLFVLPFIPAGAKFASQVWDMVSKYLISGPVLAFFLWLSFTIISSVQGGKEAILQTTLVLTEAEKFQVFIAEFGSLESILNFIVVVGLLIGSLILASQMGVAGSQFAGNVVGKLQAVGATALKSPGKLYGFGERKLAKATGGISSIFTNPMRILKGWQRQSELGKLKDEGEIMSRGAAWGRELQGKGFTRTGGLMLAASSPEDFLQTYGGWQGLKKFTRQTFGLEKTGGKAWKESEALAKVHVDELDMLEGAKSIDVAKIGKASFVDKMKDNIISKQAGFYQAGETAGTLVRMNEKTGKAEYVKVSENKDVARKMASLELESSGAFDDIPEDAKERRKELIDAKVGEYATRGAVQYVDSDGKTKVGQMNKEAALALATQYAGSAKMQEMIAARVETKKTEDNLIDEGASVLSSKIADQRAELERVKNGGYTDAEIKKMRDEQAEKTLERNELLKRFDNAYKAAGNDRRKMSIDDRALESLADTLGKSIEELGGKLEQGGPLDEEERKKRKEDSELITQLEQDYNKNQGALARASGSLKIGNQEIKTDEEVDEAMKRARASKEKIMRQVSNVPRTFYADSAYRALEAEEMKKLPSDPMEATELLSMLDDALRKKDRPLVGALLKKAAVDYNDNEFLNHYGYSADFNGMKKFKDEILRKRANMTDGHATALLNEVGYINEDKGHYETGRLAHVKHGVMTMYDTEAEHAAAVANENLKHNSRSFLQNTNRLGWGGEGPEGYKMSLSGKLTLVGFQDDIAYRIPRGEFNESALQKIAMYQLDEIKKLERLGLLTAKNKDKGNEYFGMTISQMIEKKFKTMQQRGGFVADYPVLNKYAKVIASA